MHLLRNAVDVNSLHTSRRFLAPGSTQLAHPDRTTAQLHREWLRALPVLTGRSLSQIATDAGIAPTTLYNKLRPDDPGISTLNASVIERIVRHHKVPGPGGAPMPPGVLVRGLAEDATPYTAGDPDDPLTAAVLALVAGRNAIDPWVFKTRALELDGFMPGDIVLVDLNASPRPGDAVCAQVYDWPRMKAETVMRVFERASAIELLLPRSLDPSFGPPLQVDGERVIIKGVLLRHRLRP